MDRLTLGVQTVFNQVDSDLSAKYQEAVKERMHRVDPSQQVRHLIMVLFRLGFHSLRKLKQSLN